jgi:hypothetical protein
MSGHWVGSADDVEMEEAWIEPNGGVMLGVHRDVTPGKSAIFEYLRIEDRDGTVVYIASPMGRGATEFPLLLLGERVAVFENPDHDFPQRIIYRRNGDRLTAQIEGLVDGELRSREWVWVLQE